MCSFTLTRTLEHSSNKEEERGKGERHDVEGGRTGVEIGLLDTPWCVGVDRGETGRQEGGAGAGEGNKVVCALSYGGME